MLQGYSSVMQAFLGTLFTWALTAAGAAVVLFIRGSQVSYVSGHNLTSTVNKTLR